MILTELIQKHKNAGNKLFLLDYDGTLVNFASIPGNAKPTEYLLEVLRKLIAKAHTKVIIITGRGYEDIEKLLGDLPIDIVADHGAMIRQNMQWATLFSEEQEWGKEISAILKKALLECAKSTSEEKTFSMTWHYRNSENIAGFLYSRVLIKELEKKIAPYNLRIIDGNKVIEIMSTSINKGNAVEYYLKQKEPFDFIFCVGDDKTDEDMFKVLINNTNAHTFKVGSEKSLAKYNLENVEQVISLIEQLIICE